MLLLSFINLQSAVVVVGENWRKKPFSCDHHNSLELKFGEYDDKLRIVAPFPFESRVQSPPAYGQGDYQLTSTAPSHKFGTKKCSIDLSNNSNPFPRLVSGVDPFKGLNSRNQRFNKRFNGLSIKTTLFYGIIFTIFFSLYGLLLTPNYRTYPPSY